MKAIILVTVLAFVSCSSILEPDPFRGLESNNFHFKLDGEDNLINFTESRDNSQFIVENWDMKNNKPANELMSVHFANNGREGVRTELEFFSTSYNIDSVQMLGYDYDYVLSFTDSSLIINYPYIFEFTDFDCDINFKVFFSYPN